MSSAGHLPQTARPSVKRALDEAWSAKDATRAQRLLENLARSLEGPHPGAAASLREGLEDTLTLLRIGVKGTLLQSPSAGRTETGTDNLRGRWNGTVSDRFLAQSGRGEAA